MKTSYRGYFIFPTLTFNFNDFQQTDILLFSNLINVVDEYQNEIVEIKITFDNPSPYNIKISRTVNGGTVIDYTTDLTHINEELNNIFGDKIEGIGEISTTSTNSGILSAIDLCFDYTKNIIFLYKLNSEKNVVTKSLQFVNALYVNFKRPIQYRNMILDVKISQSDTHFNYVYITSLKRFYFVNDMLLTNDYAQLTLHEDIISSWDSLIREQYAYIERNENDYDTDKVDDYVTYDYEKEVSYQTITPIIDLFKRPTDLIDKQWLLTFVAKVV